MDCYLGIDGGGSGSRWALLRDDGAVLGRGAGPALQVTAMGVEAAAAVVCSLVEAAAREHRPRAVVAGLAGAGRRATRRRIEGQVTSPVRVVGDIEVAAAASLADAPGIVIRAGTGSFAVARDGSGRLWRAGGLGPAVGDAGSACAVARSGLEAATRARNGTGPDTLLAERMPAAAAPGLDARAAAALFPGLLACAMAGDRESNRILDRAAVDLAGLALTCARNAGLEAARTEVFLGGGALVQTGYFERVVEHLAARGFPTARRAVADPAEGAAILARAVHLRQDPLCTWPEQDG